MKRYGTRLVVQWIHRVLELWGIAYPTAANGRCWPTRAGDRHAPLLSLAVNADPVTAALDRDLRESTLS